MKTGSHVVHVRRNRTVGQNGRDVTLVTLRGFASEVVDLPRFWSFEDVELPLEHRSSRTNGYCTIVH